MVSEERIDIFLDVEADEGTPKPHRVTITLSEHDLRVINLIQHSKKWSRSKALRWFVKQVARQITSAKVNETYEEGLPSFTGIVIPGDNRVVVVKLPRWMEGWRITIEYGEE